MPSKRPFTLRLRPTWLHTSLLRFTAKLYNNEEPDLRLASSLANTPSSTKQPIALFDSGVGGLTVLTRISEQLPQQDLIYIADQAHVPYGNRALKEIESFAQSLTIASFQLGAGMVLMACNISSAIYGKQAQECYGNTRVLGVVEPGAKAALKRTSKAKIGVLATTGTVSSGAYTQTIKRIQNNVEVLEVPCPKFVPFIEAGELDSPKVDIACQQALEPLKKAEVDVVILGCTHYPYLLAALQKAAPSINFVDPAIELATQVAQMYPTNNINSTKRPTYQLLTTQNEDRFRQQVNQFIETTAHVQISTLHWI